MWKKKTHQTFHSQLRSLRPSMIGVEVPMNWWSGKPRGVLPGDLRSYNNPKLRESEHVDESVSQDLRFHVKFQGPGGVFTSFIQCWLLCVWNIKDNLWCSTLRMARKRPTQQWQIWKFGRISWTRSSNWRPLKSQQLHFFGKKHEKKYRLPKHKNHLGSKTTCIRSTFENYKTFFFEPRVMFRRLSRWPIPQIWPCGTASKSPECPVS